MSLSTLATLTAVSLVYLLGRYHGRRKERAIWRGTEPLNFQNEITRIRGKCHG